MQQHQPPRRAAQVVHPRDRLLPAVAALAQVDGRPQPVDLVRDRPVVGLLAQPRPPGGDPQGLVRPGAGQRRVPRRTPRARSRGTSTSRSSQPGWSRSDDRGVRRAARRPAAATGRPRRPARPARPRGAPARRRPPTRAVTSATSTRSMNRIESSQATSAGAVPGSTVIQVVLAVVDQVQVVLDVAVRGQDQRLGARVRRQVVQLLGGQRVQPAQPVRAGDGDDAAVGEVDRAGAARRTCAARAGGRRSARRRRRPGPRPARRRARLSSGLGADGRPAGGARLGSVLTMVQASHAARCFPVRRDRGLPRQGPAARSALVRRR